MTRDDQDRIKKEAWNRSIVARAREGSVFHDEIINALATMVWELEQDEEVPNKGLKFVTMGHDIYVVDEEGG